MHVFHIHLILFEWLRVMAVGNRQTNKTPASYVTVEQVVSLSLSP